MIQKACRVVFASVSLALVACGTQTALAGSRISISPAVTFSKFGDDLAFDQAFGYALSVAYHSDSDLSFRLTGNITPTEEEFALVGGVGHYRASVAAIRFQAEYRLFQVGGAFSVQASASGGILIVSTEEHTVSLGALGQQTIAPHSESLLLYGAGLALHQRIAGNVSFRLEPSVSFYSHNGSSHSLLSLAGGLSVGIL